MQNEQAVSAEDMLQRDSAADSVTCEAQARGRTILAVDDDPIILMNTCALLEDLGHQVVEAGCGQEALDCLARRPEIDLLMTDHAMPGMTGSELIDAARLLRPDLSIILATGYAAGSTPQVRDLTRLNKPYSFAELETAVARASE